MDENGNIKNFVEVDDRREPVVAQIARIRNHKEAPHNLVAEVYFFRANFQRRRRDDIFQVKLLGLIKLAWQACQVLILLFFCKNIE